MGDKSEEEELEGCRDIITEDRVSKRIKKYLFLDRDRIKEAAGFYLACSRDNANPCLGEICRERQEC